jgi:hypothetical protein
VRAPLLIRLPLHPRRRSSKAVAIAVTGAAAATAVRVTASIGGLARQAGVRDASFPVTLGVEETGVDDVAIVAILVIGGMVVAALGGSFSGKAGDVEVTTEPADGRSPPAPRLIGGRR